MMGRLSSVLVVLCVELASIHGFYFGEEPNRFLIPELMFMSPTSGAIDGGERVIMIWKDMIIDSQYLPKIKFEIGTFSLIVKNLRVMNCSTEIVDFRNYQYMEPESNDALKAQWCQPQWLVTEIVTQRIPRLESTTTFSVFLMFNGMLIKGYKPCVNGQDPALATIESFGCKNNEKLVAWHFHFHVHPKFRDIYPQLAPSQGGTRVTVSGQDFVVWPSDTPVMQVFSLGITLGVKTSYMSSTQIIFETPPQILNHTDFYSSASLLITFNRQRFYQSPFELKQYDSTGVRWGDAIALAHLQSKEFVLTTGRNVRSRGSENQIFTAVRELDEDTNKFFIIREPLPVFQGGATSSHYSHGLSTDASFSTTGRVARRKLNGQMIVCDSTIRLMHARTSTYLSSYYHELPDSKEQEVFANGQYGVGDTDDNWVVKCEPNTRFGYSWKWDYIKNEALKMFEFDRKFQEYRTQSALDSNNILWRPSTVIRLFHPNSGKYLTFNNMDVSAHVCPPCFRNKHKQISATELTKGEEQRFFVKRQTRMLIECDLSKESLPKRWRVEDRALRVGDFVVWRNASQVACDVRGPLKVDHQEFMMETRFGKVLDMIEVTNMVVVEEYHERANIYSSTTRKYSQTIHRQKYALGRLTVHGPVFTKPEKVEWPALGKREWVVAYFDDFKDYTKPVTPN